MTKDKSYPGACLLFWLKQTLSWTRDLGYRQMFWSIAYVDWHEDCEVGYEYLYNQVMDQRHPGAVILMHALSEDNPLA